MLEGEKAVHWIAPSAVCRTWEEIREDPVLRHGRRQLRDMASAPCTKEEFSQNWAMIPRGACAIQLAEAFEDKEEDLLMLSIDLLLLPCLVTAAIAVALWRSSPGLHRANLRDEDSLEGQGILRQRRKNDSAEQRLHVVTMT